MTTISTTRLQAADASRAVALALSMLLGLFIIGFAGFSQMDVMHNAAHDYRHSMAFPCH